MRNQDLTYHQKSVFGDRYQQTINETVEEMFRRCATAVAKDTPVLGMNREAQITMFENIMLEDRGTIAGRPLSNLGPNGNNMAFNCFVIPIQDSRKSITGTLADFTEIAAMGGGIGISYSKLRPKGDLTKKSRGKASGPCSFIDVFQSMGGTIKQNGSRGLATMTSLAIDHPDIEEFITSKLEDGRWPTTNISVEVSDEFMKAVEEDREFNLIWNGEIRKTVKAKYLWDMICKYAHTNGEPGVLFVDTMNKNTPYAGYLVIETVNPCAEQCLPPNTACNLGSVNVSHFVDMKNKTVDFEGIEQTAYEMAIFLDSSIDTSTYPTEAIEENVKKYRPIGLGIMGFADLLLYCDIPYGDNPQALRMAGRIASTVYQGALRASTSLCEQFGPFPGYDPEISDYAPRRNVTVTSYAPTGSISAFFNVSSGIEPHFAPVTVRREEIGTNTVRTAGLDNYMQYHNLTEIPKHARFSVDGPKGTELTTMDHLAILREFAINCDSSVSKTINLPEEATVDDVSDVFKYCWENGIKGCTVYRNNSRKNAPIQGTGKKDSPMEEKVEGGLSSDGEETDDYDEDDLIEVVEITPKPRSRPLILEGRTIPIKPDPNGPTIWITINNYEDSPFEIFFNTSDATHQEFLNALGRSITSQWRAGFDIHHLLKDFCAYESPNSGNFCEYAPGKRKRFKSILDGIGTVILEHIRVTVDEEPPTTHTRRVRLAETLGEPKDEDSYADCPECGLHTYRIGYGCPVCENCGYSKCG